MLSKVICYQNHIKIVNQNFSSYEDALNFAISKNEYENCCCLVFIFDEKTMKWRKTTTLYQSESF